MPTTSFVRVIAAEPVAVFDHLVSPESIGAWWGPDTVEFEAVRPTSLRYTWQWDHEAHPISMVSVVIEARTEGCELRLTQTADTPEEASEHRAGWEHFLERFCAHAVGG